MGAYRDHGAALIANGYHVIPIRHGSKRPFGEGWEQSRRTAADFAHDCMVRELADCGLGILTGTEAGVYAVDIDTLSKPLAEAMIEWCEKNLGYTAVRVGKAPKTLMVYRSNPGLAKVTGTTFTDQEGTRHRLEILGLGQQFVAYGEHPDTQQPYEWTDMVGGLLAMPADTVPAITPEQMAQANAEFTRLALHYGLQPKTASRALSDPFIDARDDDPFASTPVGISVDEATQLVRWMDPEDYDLWLQVGMALHHEGRGSPDWLDVWDRWSSEAANYAGYSDLEYRWGGFGRRTDRPVTIRFLLKEAHIAERRAELAGRVALRDNALARVSGATDADTLLSVIAPEVGATAVNSAALRAELVGVIQAKFKELTEQRLPIAEARKALKPATAPKPAAPTTKRERTEFGNAERMLDRYGDGLMYVAELDQWYSWSGVYWRRVSNTEIEYRAKETVRLLPTEIKPEMGDEEREAFLKFAAASQRAVMVRNMVSLAASDPRVATPVGKVDAEHHLLGTANGVVDLRNGQFYEPDPSYRIATVTRADYIPGAQCPLFEETLLDVFSGDAEMVAFFQRLIGYSILGQPKESLLIIPYGNGANGKSTILGTIRYVLGGYAKTANAETFLSAGAGAANAGAAREDVLRLIGARFAYISEPDEGSELREGLVKSMTGGDAIPARGLWSKATVEVEPTWVAFMPTNHRPVVKGDDHAIWRRLMPIPFTRNFDLDPSAVKDPNRADKLRTEAEGILTWIIQGALEYQRIGLKPPSAVAGARRAYREDMDLLGEWMEASCDVGPTEFASISQLWASWEQFARGRGELGYIRSARALGRRLSGRFTADRRGQIRGYRGISVRDGFSGFDEVDSLA